jgi:Holliday junction resolvase
MANSNRQRGDYFERQTRDALRAHGWVVVRAAGSLGPADIVALRGDKKPLLVSCKVTRRDERPRISPAERLALVEAAEQAGARALLACRSVGGWVDLYAVRIAPTLIRVDRLKVPAR